MAGRRDLYIVSVCRGICEEFRAVFRLTFCEVFDGFVNSFRSICKITPPPSEVSLGALSGDIHSYFIGQIRHRLSSLEQSGSFDGGTGQSCKGFVCGEVLE